MERANHAFNIEEFKECIARVKAAKRQEKEAEIAKLLAFPGLNCHYRHRQTKRLIVAECETFQYTHELDASKKLARANYDVLLLPESFFKGYEKKFDIFLLRDNIFLEADLKTINTSTKARTIANRIIEGSTQARRIVLDITSQIDKNALIEGLKSGSYKNEALLEILLFYRSQFFILPKNLILSPKLFDVFK